MNISHTVHKRNNELSLQNNQIYSLHGLISPNISNASSPSRVEDYSAQYKAGEWTCPSLEVFSVERGICAWKIFLLSIVHAKGGV